MLDFASAYVEMEVLRVHDGAKGVIREIGDRRPVRALVEWSDGSSSWMHPEQIRKPDVLQAQNPSRMTGFGRTTPQHIIDIRVAGWRERRKKPWVQRIDLEQEANKILSAGKPSKAKRRIKDFERRNDRTRTSR